ncbi:ABC transporter ATP-binding protein [Herbaspirillum sp. YR522]|uniref:ABC transporter ATP-binding protein n=1 Tax=Herbaspirillum sp. YR522 TaxID=1144342 RepID=UPI00026FBC11|nr:ABC transporter ATP-binding protein [Herbaspirillum sp. YR522]EJN07747.1 ABC-type spermidine/putrescine transport system, ATPase component [Herbaspirillum sp. YR522]
MTSSNTSIECRQIHLRRENRDVLRDINLRIEPGEFFVLLGASGSGKSSLLRVIAGLIPDHGGLLLLDGKDAVGIAPHRRNIGMVFQDYALWPHMSVRENVAYGLEERRVPREQIRARVDQVLARVGLGELGQRRPDQISGGQRQRAALARAIVIEPRVLLLDEPFSNLDHALRAQLRQELRSLQRNLGITTVFVTHDQEEAMAMADRMAVIEDGVVQQLGTPAALYDYPINTFMAGFVGNTNLLTGSMTRVHGDMMRFSSSQLGVLMLPHHRDAGEGEYALSIRPHVIRITVSDAQRDGALVWMEGTVEHREFFGAFTRYRVRVGHSQVVVDQAHYAALTPFPLSMQVALGIMPSQIRYLPL